MSSDSDSDSDITQPTNAFKDEVNQIFDINKVQFYYMCLN